MIPCLMQRALFVPAPEQPGNSEQKRSDKYQSPPCRFSYRTDSFCNALSCVDSYNPKYHQKYKGGSPAYAVNCHNRPACKNVRSAYDICQENIKSRVRTAYTNISKQKTE